MGENDKIFNEFTVQKFLDSLLNYKDPDMLKVELARFVISTFDGVSFMLKTKESDPGRSVIDVNEQLEFIAAVLLHCEKMEEYEICKELTEVRNAIEK